MGSSTKFDYMGVQGPMSWFVENFGFEYKQKCAKAAREGTGTEFKRRNQENLNQNTCHLPLLHYHLDDRKFLHTKKLKSFYSSVMSAEGITKYGKDIKKMPAWWIAPGASEEEAIRDKNFWLIQKGCNPPTGMNHFNLNWPMTMKKYLTRCYLYHLGSMEVVNDYYVHYNSTEGDEDEEKDDTKEDIDESNDHDDNEAIVDSAKDVGDHSDEEAMRENSDGDETEEISWTPGYLKGAFSMGQAEKMPVIKEPALLQFRAKMINSDGRHKFRFCDGLHSTWKIAALRNEDDLLKLDKFAMIKVKESYLHEGLLKIGEFEESSENPGQKMLAPGVVEGPMLKNDFHDIWSKEHLAWKVKVTNTLPPKKSVINQFTSQPSQSSKPSTSASSRSQPAEQSKPLRTTTNKRKPKNSDVESEGESEQTQPSGRPVRSSLKCDTCHKSFSSAGRLMTHYEKSVTCSISK